MDSADDAFLLMNAASAILLMDSAASTNETAADQRVILLNG